MFNWLLSMLIGCNHKYEPYGKEVDVYKDEKNKLPLWIQQSQRCTKCGKITIMKV